MTTLDVTIGCCRLLCRDAYELLPMLKADALITDPPYGIGFDWRKDRTRRQLTLWSPPPNSPSPWRTATMVGDDQPFDPRPWLHYPQIILWGGHLYAQHLPPSPAWLIWDKREGVTPDDNGDAELAWTNLPRAPRVTRIHRQLWRGLIRRGEENGTWGHKLHPTQKPIALMRWCVQKTTGAVCDPFAGSFTTALACLEMGRPCLAVEIDPHYWEVGCERLTAAARQLSLFTPPPAPPSLTQHALFA